MFQFALLWRVNSALTDKEPGYKATIKRNPTRMIKARIEQDGTKVFYVHKLGTYKNEAYWYWTKYKLEEGNIVTELRSGMYPSFFSDGK